MTSKWLFSGALFFELSSWGGLLSNPTLLQGLYLYVLPHALAALLLTVALWLLLPQRYKWPLPWSPLLLFSLIFFIPVVGAVGTVGGVFVGLYLPRRHREEGWQLTAMPVLPFRAVAEWRSPLFQDGGLQDVLQLASDPEQRLAALLATKSMPGNEAVPLLQLALRDTEDDVRLLAYSMLDQRETAISQKIEYLLAQIAEGAESPAATHAALARWYWELAYLGLAQGAVLEHILAQALEHVRLAIAASNDPAHELLAGRILLAGGNAAEARQHFMRAREGGISAGRLAPFFAEAAFVERRYEEVAMHLQMIPDDMRKQPLLAASARYWL